MNMKREDLTNYQEGQLIEVRVIGLFDLGLLAQTQDGISCQLRFPEMTGYVRHLHIKGEDQQLVGQSLWVFIIFLNREGGLLLSQLSPPERHERECLQHALQEAKRLTPLGSLLEVRVVQAFAEGAFCESPILGGVYLVSHHEFPQNTIHLPSTAIEPASTKYLERLQPNTQISVRLVAKSEDSRKLYVALPKS